MTGTFICKYLSTDYEPVLDDTLSEFWVTLATPAWFEDVYASAIPAHSLSKNPPVRVVIKANNDSYQQELNAFVCLYLGELKDSLFQKWLRILSVKAPTCVLNAWQA